MPISGDIRGLGRNFTHHLRAHIFQRIFQLDLLGNRHTVFGDGWGAELFVDDYVAALRPESYLDGVRQRVDAAQNRLAGFFNPRAVCCFAMSNFSFKSCGEAAMLTSS